MRLYLRQNERRPDPAPVDTDDRRAISVGLALWLIALVVVLVISPSGDGGMALWTCVTGVLLGVAGIVYSILRRRRRRLRSARLHR